MTTVIIEDEPLAAERLQILLQQCEIAVEVLTVIDSVEEASAWLNSHPAPDFLLADIHLADGYVFELFKKTANITPVIFTTAYNQYAIDAFKVLSIDYLLKPVTLAALKQALGKLQLLNANLSLSNVHYKQLTTFLEQTHHHYKSRFLGKVGQKIFFIDVDTIAFFWADDKIVYLYCNEGNKYVIDYTLESIEAVLDPALFFRANRQAIINASAIDMVKSFLNNRLKITLKGINKQQEIVISRNRVSQFKKWAEQ
jgi:DNA-binding LytR/AlgR family response regulator